MRAARKPLGGRGYGSISHLHGSRMGPGDHKIHEGQANICVKKARDKHDRIIVTEKLDGSNVCIARVDDEIFAIGRAGYLAQTSPYRQHKVFAAWVRSQEERFRTVLARGQRIVGEWIYQAHGTLYRPVGEPFIAFDVMEGKARMPHDDARRLFAHAGLEAAHVIHDGGPLSIDDALALLGDFGFHGAEEKVEGAVWRVERSGSFDFAAKYVRPDKIDGKYLPGCNGLSNDAPEIIMFPDLTQSEAAE